MRTWLGRVGVALIACGLAIVLVSYLSFRTQQSTLSHQAALWQERAAAPSRPGPENTDPPAGTVDFAIRVPKLGYSAPVEEGTSLDVLYASPGHYAGSAWPGQPGTVGVAAHNIYWINFDQLVPGDLVYLDTSYGEYTYSVTGSAIVEPTDVRVLQRPGPPNLTLTSCWPLWAGQWATQRFVVFTVQTHPVPAEPLRS